ncbi:MAG TPA: phosphatidate cytidylyltransferase [Streptosporangiaceae bacterium]|nr:phosphatidate cytidylyltransferase [Streptosporangiaceae bacterium]
MRLEDESQRNAEGVRQEVGEHPADTSVNGQAGSYPPDGEDRGQRRPVKTGRNLPAAVAVGLVLGGLALLTLFTVKATFLLYVGIVLAIALWELGHALRSRDIHLPLVPITVGGVAIVSLAYFTSARWVLAATALTVVAVLAWRLPGGAAGYVGDVTAGLFTVVYLPLMAAFVALMLAAPDGARRTLLFVVLTVCSDTGGYLAGILVGKHPMAPAISPKKTWEGLGGSLLLCLVAGLLLLPELLGGQLWQGLVLGLAAVCAATLGDLVESMIKRDLEIKDMGHLLPGHGGVMERIDSLLVMAPVVWLLLAVFIPNGHAA